MAWLRRRLCQMYVARHVKMPTPETPIPTQIWRSEGAEYITEKVPADTKTIFIDGQIILMQSRVDGCRTWREFALNVFGRRLRLPIHTHMHNVCVVFFLGLRGVLYIAGFKI